MKNVIYTLGLLIGISNCFAQDVNELTYVTNITKSDMKAVKVGENRDTFIITQQPTFIICDTKLENKKMQSSVNPKILDLEEKLAVIDYAVYNVFFIETIDSFCRSSEFVKTGETKKINGYTCEKYHIDNEKRYKAGGLNIAPATSVQYDFDIWVTKDINALNQDLLISSSLLNRNLGSLTGQGVIVKIEGSSTMSKKSMLYEINLIKVKNNTSAKVTYEKPWKKPNYKLMVPSFDGQPFGTGTIEPIKVKRLRVIALLEKILGEPKLKSVKVQDMPYYNVYYNL